MLELQDEDVPWLSIALNNSRKYVRDEEALQQISDRLVNFLETVNPGMSKTIREMQVDWEQELDGRVIESVQAFSNRHHLEDDPDAPTRKPAIVLRADKDITYETINKVITLARSKNLGIFLVTDIEKKQGVPEVNILEEP